MRRRFIQLALIGALPLASYAQEDAQTTIEPEVVAAAEVESPPIGAADAVTTPIATDAIDTTAPAFEIDLANVERLLREGAFDSAANAGKRLVVTSIDTHGRDSLETADSLTLLARAQHRSGDHDSAVENFRASVEIIEDRTDRLDSRLITPLRGLGRAHLALDRPDRASEAFERSLHVKQVNEGPQNLDQIAQLGELTEAYYLLGDFKQAHALQKYSVALYEREYPNAGDKRRIPILYQYARWLNRMGLFMREQTAYVQIIRIVERAEGKDSIELIPALTGLGKTYIYSVDTEAQAVGERRLRRAISIANDADNPTLVADTEISLGDFYTLTGDRTGAKRAYLRAWDHFTEAEADLIAERDRRFSTPYPLTTQDARTETFAGTDIEDFKNSLGSEPDRGYVILEYRINSRGSVRDVRVIEAEPTGFRDKEAIAWVKKFKFRPRVVDRDLVETTNQVYEYTYNYYPAALQAEQAERTAAK